MLGFVNFGYSQVKLAISPEYPQPGDRVHIVYNPSAPGASIADTVTHIDLVFTYSNFYELPNKIPLTKKEGKWETSFNIPSYAVHATYTLVSGAQVDKLSDKRHFPIYVYNGTKRVERSYLYESYSLATQEGKSKELAENKAVLIKKELENYPQEYQARLNMLLHQTTLAKKKDVPALRKKMQQIVADKFYESPGKMGVLNTTTMGYLMIGEPSRLDSIRKVVLEKYPNSEAGYEMRIDQITDNADKEEMARTLLEMVKNENEENKGFLKSAHQALFKYYAAKKMPAEALTELKKIGIDESPYQAETLKRQAETLYENGIALDKSMELALKSLALADTFPAGLIRFFPETGYLPSYVPRDVRLKSELKAKGSLNVLIGLIEAKRGNQHAADYYVKKGLRYSTDEETLTKAAAYFEANKDYKKAFDLYKQTATAYPLDTTSFNKMVANYKLFSKDENSLAATIDSIEMHWAAEMKQELLGEIINTETAEFLSNLVDLKGNSLPTDLLKNKIVVLNFWATWCAPCMKEMPYMQLAYNKYKNDPNVVFMIVNSGSNNQLSDAQNWWGNKKFDFPVYYNKDRSIGEKLNFNVIPATYVIDKNYRMRFKTIGFEGPIIEHKIPAAIELLKEGKN